MRSFRLKRRVEPSRVMIAALLLGLVAATVLVGDTPARSVFVFLSLLVVLIGVFMFTSRTRTTTQA
jgi:Membrane-bound toxin component of toxin-antitoxin system